MEERKWCVYCHTNKINGKKYIGITSRDVNVRWGKNGYNYLHYSYKFGGAIKKYKWKNFKHEILYSNLTENEAKWKEKFLIKYYDSFRHGYNNTLGGDGTCGYFKTKDSLIKMRENHRLTRKINQYNLNGILLNTFPSIRETSYATGIDRKEISKCVNKKYRMTHGFIFLDSSEDFNIINKKKRSSTTIINKYDTSGNFIKQYIGLNECCLENSINTSSLLRNMSGKLLQCKGFVYRRDSDDFDTYRTVITEQMYENMKHIGINSKQRKEIVCENVRFITITDCSKKYLKSSSTIGQYLNNKKPTPQKWLDRGLRYYNPETDKDLPIYVDTKDEV